MADPPDQKQDLDDFIKRGLSPRPSALPQATPPKNTDVLNIPGLGVVPNPAARGKQQAEERMMNPVYQAGILGAGFEGLGMLVPPLVDAGIGTMLPRLFRGAAKTPFPSAGEVSGNMLAAGAGGAAGAGTEQAGKGTFAEPYTDILGPAVGMGTGPGLQKIGRSIAPKVTKEVQATAREAEKAGFRLTPGQVATGKPKSFTAYDQYNNVRANQLLTEGALTKADRVTPDWLRRVDKKYDQAYEYIFSPSNIFALHVGPQDNVVNTVLAGKGMNAQVDKFISELMTKAPFATQPSVFPIAGGLRSNTAFLPMDGPTLRAARDETRKLQKSSDPATRHYGNEVWDAMMRNLQASDAALHSELVKTNAGYRVYRLIDDMDMSRAINKSGDVDLLWLDNALSKGWASKGYRHGTDKSVAAKLGRYGRDLSISPNPKDPSNAEKYMEWAFGASGLGLGALAPYLMSGAKEFSWPSAVGAGLGVTAALPVRKALTSGAKSLGRVPGRFGQRVTTPQADDLAQRNALWRLYGGGRTSLSSLLGQLSTQEDK